METCLNLCTVNTSKRGLSCAVENSQSGEVRRHDRAARKNLTGDLRESKSFNRLELFDLMAVIVKNSITHIAYGILRVFKITFKWKMQILSYKKLQ